MPSSKSARGGKQGRQSGKPTILQQPKIIEEHHETEIARTSKRSRTSKALFDNSWVPKAKPPAKGKDKVPTLAKVRKETSVKEAAEYHDTENLKDMLGFLNSKVGPQC
jgi:outer membrane scaffolding protein for murein synthesis (MipA/OmpV family)